MLTPASGPTATPLSDPTGTPAVPPAAYVSYFGTLPPGAPLPGEAACAREVARDPWEPRPDNRVANQTNPFTQGFRLRDSYLGSYGPGYEDRVTGNFTGTTDEIIRWGACKWGFDENTVRAQAVVESFWRQSTRGDCGVRAQPGMNGCASVGILQVKGADLPPTHPGTWPAAHDSTAFNVDYTLAVRRLCFEGRETWLRDFNPSYGPGDLWGCLGRWYSGRWHDVEADRYIQTVRAALAAKTWRTF